MCRNRALICMQWHPFVSQLFKINALYNNITIVIHCITWKNAREGVKHCLNCEIAMMARQICLCNKLLRFTTFHRWRILSPTTILITIFIANVFEGWSFIIVSMYLCNRLIFRIILSCDKPSLQIKWIEQVISSCHWLFYFILIFGEQDTTSSGFGKNDRNESKENETNNIVFLWSFS